MGAWIETLSQEEGTDDALVASYMGAWIETLAALSYATKRWGSHPTWVRGLKQIAPEYLGTTKNRRILHGCVD